MMTRILALSTGMFLLSSFVITPIVLSAESEITLTEKEGRIAIGLLRDEPTFLSYLCAVEAYDTGNIELSKKYSKVFGKIASNDISEITQTEAERIKAFMAQEVRNEVQKSINDHNWTHELWIQSCEKSLPTYNKTVASDSQEDSSVLNWIGDLMFNGPGALLRLFGLPNF